MSMQLVGVKELNLHLEALGDDMQRVVQQVVQDLATEALARMKADVPVDTGELRASLKLTVLPTGVRLEAGADHGWFIEYGTVRSAAQPFFNMPVESMVRQIKPTLFQEIQKRLAQ